MTQWRNESTCQHDRRGRFCSRCGLDLSPPRLTYRALYQELIASWLQRGFRQTALGLLLSPGTQLRGYLRADRSLLIKPVSYLIVVAAFHLWVLSLLSHSNGDIDPAALGLTDVGSVDPVLVQALLWLMHHFYQFALLQAGLMALSLRYVFYRHSGYSMAEYMIVVTYLLTQSILIQAVLTLLYIPFQRPMPGVVHFAIGISYVSFAIGQFHRATRPLDWLRALSAYATAMLVVFITLIGLLFLWERSHAAVENTMQKIEQPAP